MGLLIGQHSVGCWRFGGNTHFNVQYFKASYLLLEVLYIIIRITMGLEQLHRNRRWYFLFFKSSKTCSVFIFKLQMETFYHDKESLWQHICLTFVRFLPCLHGVFSRYSSLLSHSKTSKMVLIEDSFGSICVSSASLAQSAVEMYAWREFSFLLAI